MPLGPFSMHTRRTAQSLHNRPHRLGDGDEPGLSTTAGLWLEKGRGAPTNYLHRIQNLVREGPRPLTMVGVLWGPFLHRQSLSDACVTSPPACGQSPNHWVYCE